MAADLYDLPQLGFNMLVGNNEDWVDSWAYLDASSNPIVLPPITYIMQLRSSPASPVLSLLAANVPSFGQFSRYGTLTPGGTGNNVLALNILAAQMARVPISSFFFEVQGIDGTRARTIASGTVQVKQGVVR